MFWTAGCAGRRATTHTGHDPYRGFVDVIGQILGRVEHPPKALGAGSGSRFAGPISRRDHFIPGPLVVVPDRLLDLRVANDEEPPALHVAAGRRRHARFKNFFESTPQEPGPVSADASTG